VSDFIHCREFYLLFFKPSDDLSYILIDLVKEVVDLGLTFKGVGNGTNNGLKLRLQLPEMPNPVVESVRDN
jgi:hypothetical protein